MPVKIKKSQRKLIALTITELVKPRFFRILNAFIKREIINIIEAGRSPVAKGGTSPRGTGGKLRYEKYSDDYLKSIGNGSIKGKKKRPVNLTVTGKMLRSIKSRKFKNYLRVWFTDSKAKYHDKLGAGKSKILRRMVPNPAKGEKFNAVLQKKIVNALKLAIKLSKR